MEDVHHHPGIEAAPPVQRVTPGHLFGWLRAGISDLMRAPMASLFYGVVFAVVGYVALGVLGRLAHLVTAMISGFLLLSPFLAVGLYRISQRLEAGERPTLGDSMTAWRLNYGSIGLFAAFLGFAFIFWERISAILFALFYGRQPPAVEEPGGWIFLMAAENPAFVALYMLVGGIAAAAVYAVSVVSIPMMLHRPVDPVTALITSLRAVGENPITLGLWAVVIVALFALGVVTWFVGLVVIMPVLGHASWHAYRSLVGAPATST